MRCKACQGEQSSAIFFCEECGEPLLEGKEIGSFRLLEQIGSGGMGIVYRAEHSRLKTPYAIKVLSPEIYTQELEKKRFLREAQATAQLRHEHIVFIADFGEMKGLGLYLVMEYLQGKTLKKWLKSGQILSLGRTWNIVYQISQTMDYAHAQGIIHRDLKPENIFLLDRRDGQDDFIKIFDFGIAKVAKEPHLHMTQTGSFLGTPAYMSPEQMHGKVDHRTDIYALGVILFRMLTGQRPFPYQSIAELIQAKMNRDAPTLSSIVPDYAQTEWEKLVACCLQRDPEKRPASMKEVQQWLERIEQEPTSFSIEPTRASLPPVPRPFLGAELPSAEPSDSSSVSSSVPQQSASSSVDSELSKPQNVAQRWNVPTGELDSLSQKRPSRMRTWLSSYQFTLLLLSLLVGAGVGWYRMNRSPHPQHPSHRSHSKHAVSARQIQGGSKAQTQSPDLPLRSLHVHRDRVVAGVTSPLREQPHALSGTSKSASLDVVSSGKRSKPLSRKQSRTYQKHKRNLSGRKKSPEASDALVVQPHIRLVSAVTPEPVVTPPTEPCPGSWGGRWVFIQIKNPRILPKLETQGAWKRSRIGKGWCLQVSSRSAKVILDGNEHNLASCEFHVSSHSPTRIPVMLRDPDDVVAFSDYCLR